MMRQDLNVTSWQLFGHDRLYVNLPDGTAIGWADRVTGTITVLHPRYRDAVTDALARQVPAGPVLDRTQRKPPSIPPIPRMRPRDGHGAPQGPSARSPQVPYAVTHAHPVLPALTPENDLASRRPGAALRAELAGSGPGELVRAATGALRRRKDADPRRAALTGERHVGAELKRLTRHGWRVLHSVPLPGGAEIGHLLIGPGGVFTVTAEHHPHASVRIADGTLRLDDGTPQTYVLGIRPETRRAQQTLQAHCAFPVPVETVLVFVGVTALEVLATPPGVRVCQERQLSALAPLTGVLTATQVERVYDVARNREAWPAG